MGRLWALAKSAGLVIGLFLTYGPLYFAAQDAQKLGLSWNAWLAVGVTILVLSAGSVIVGLLRENTRLTEVQPDLELGEAELVSDQKLVRTQMRSPVSIEFPPPPPVPTLHEVLDVALYRIPVRNSGGHAPAVTAKFVDASPPIPRGLKRAILHRAGDNPDDRTSFAESFPIHRDDEADIDVVSFTTKEKPPRFFLYKIASRDAAEETQLEADSYVFTIGAFAGNVSDLREYRIDKDPLSGRLTMTRLPSGHKRDSPPQ